jgi:hypothetical protein
MWLTRERGKLDEARGVLISASSEFAKLACRSAYLVRQWDINT